MTALAVPTTWRWRPAHLAALAMALAILFSPVSQLTPRGGFEKVPMLVETALLAALLARWVFVGLHPTPVRTLAIVLVAIAHATLTGLWAIDQRIWLLYGVRALHAALWTFGIFAAVGNRRDLLLLLRSFHAFGCATALVGIAQLLLPSMQADFTRENTEGAIGAALKWDDELGAGSIVRVTGTLAHPLGLALALGCILPWTPALWQAARTPLGKLLVAASTSVQLVGLALTYSRMAVLALGITAVLWVVRGGVRRPGTVLLAMALVGIFSLPLLPATLVERVFDPSHFQQSDSLLARMEMQLYGSDIGMQHGFLGLGYGCYGTAFEATAMGRYVEQARWMLSQDDWASYDLGDVGGHNTWLEIWVEQGALGLLLAGGILFVLVRELLARIHRAPRYGLDRNLGLCCEAGLVALLVSTTVIHVQEAVVPWAWLGLVCAWIGPGQHAGGQP